LAGGHGNGAYDGDGLNRSIPAALFPAHVAHLHAENGLGFCKEFEMLKMSNSDSTKPFYFNGHGISTGLQRAPGSPALTANVSLRPENKEKNRYSNVLACEYSLIHKRSILPIILLR
jgi:hypothetical protein